MPADIRAIHLGGEYSASGFARYSAWLDADIEAEVQRRAPQPAKAETSEDAREAGTQQRTAQTTQAEASEDAFDYPTKAEASEDAFDYLLRTGGTSRPDAGGEDMQRTLAAIQRRYVRALQAALEPEVPVADAALFLREYVEHRHQLAYHVWILDLLALDMAPEKLLATAEALRAGFKLLDATARHGPVVFAIPIAIKVYDPGTGAPGEILLHVKEDVSRQTGVLAANARQVPQHPGSGEKRRRRRRK